jgi:hypothetical protein
MFRFQEDSYFSKALRRMLRLHTTASVMTVTGTSNDCLRTQGIYDARLKPLSITHFSFPFLSMYCLLSLLCVCVLFVCFRLMPFQ